MALFSRWASNFETLTCCSSDLCPHSGPCSGVSIRQRFHRIADAVHRNRGEGSKPDRHRHRGLPVCPSRARRHASFGWRGGRHWNRGTRGQRSDMALGRLADDKTESESQPHPIEQRGLSCRKPISSDATESSRAYTSPSRTSALNGLSSTLCASAQSVSLTFSKAFLLV